VRRVRTREKENKEEKKRKEEKEIWRGGGEFLDRKCKGERNISVFGEYKFCGKEKLIVKGVAAIRIFSSWFVF
jgi:hypothetical protein